MAGLSRYIKAKLVSYFKAKLGAIVYNKGWLKARCPYCGREAKFGIHLGMNRTNCFRCESRPSPVSLVMELEGLDQYHEFTRFIESITTISKYDFSEEEVTLGSKVEINLPEGFKLFGSNDDSTFGKIATKYARGRGFDISTLRRLGWGYCVSGPLFGYMVIPFFESGKMVYYNARLIVGSGPRYKNPDTENSGIGKSYLIYNEDALVLYDKIYLCEGAINAVTLGEKAISSGGKSLSRYQHNLILKSPVTEVVIILDPDAKVKAIETALILSELKRVKVVFLPDGKDVNDLGKSATMKYIRETPFVNTKDLLILKQKLQQIKIHKL